MMTRFFLYLCLLSIAAVPALADPRRPREGLREGGGMARMQERRMPEGRIFEPGMRDSVRGEAGPRPEMGGGRPPYDPDAEDRPPIRRRPEQDRAREAMRAGELRPLRDIQQHWRQDMPGYDYLGADYDAGAGSYRLKFLRDGSVVWIDVDGRTGREIGRRGR